MKLFLLLSLVTLPLLLESRGLSNFENGTNLTWINDSPYTILARRFSSNPENVSNFYVTPIAIGPFAHIDYLLTTGEDSEVSIKWIFLLGDIGDLEDINSGLTLPKSGWEESTKQLGEIEYLFFKENNRTFFSLRSSTRDPLIDQRLDFLRIRYQIQAGPDEPWIDFSGVTELLGDEPSLKILIDQDSTANNSKVLSAQQLVDAWNRIDPEGKGQVMQNLKNCVYSSDESSFNRAKVLDDFDDQYNSVGWSIGMKKNIQTPLNSHQDAISFYKHHGYVPTDCHAEGETRPSIALYCVEDCRNFTHVAVKIPSDWLNFGEVWTSKFGNGPLLSHSSFSSISGSCNETEATYGDVKLCFRKQYDIEVEFQNDSPFYLTVYNASNFKGEWILQPVSLKPFESSLSSLLVSGKESQGQTWYEVKLGDISKASFAKTIGLFSFSSQVSAHFKRNNLANLYENLDIIPQWESKLLDISYSGQAGSSFEDAEEGTVAIDGYPLKFNITAGWPGIDGETWLRKIEEVDPIHKARTLQDIKSCLYTDETAFDTAKLIDDFDGNYNAFGWSIGNTQQGIIHKPSTSYESAIDFYASYNYTPTSCLKNSAIIALYCIPNEDRSVNGGCTLNYDIALGGYYNYTHAALKLPNGEWSSKFWSGPLLTHSELESISNLNEVEGECLSLPTRVGTPILCFQGNDFFSHKLVETYPIFNETNSPNILGDYSVYGSIQNQSPFFMVRPYEKRVEYVCGNSDFLPNWIPTCYMFWTEYYGLTSSHGYWDVKPQKWVGPFGQNDSFVLEDHFWLRGTEGSLAYKFTLGDMNRYVDDEETRNFTKIKDFGQISFSFLCPLSDNNQANVYPKAIKNPATLLKDKDYWNIPTGGKNADLVLTEVNFVGWSSRTKKDEGVPNSVASSGHPILLDFTLSPSKLTLKKLLDTWLESSIGMSAQRFKFMVEHIFFKTAAAFGASYDYPVPIPSPTQKNIADYKFNCNASPLHAKVCNTIVLDDADNAYNCAAWASGISTGGFFDYPLMTKRIAENWFTSLGYTKTSCRNSNGTLASDITIATYCHFIPGTDSCISGPNGGGRLDNQTNLEINHFAIKLPSGKWSSKLGFNPLVIHDSPEDLKGYGEIVLCFKGKTFLDATHRPQAPRQTAFTIPTQPYLPSSTSQSYEDLIQNGSITTEEDQALQKIRALVDKKTEDEFSGLWLQFSISHLSLGSPSLGRDQQKDYEDASKAIVDFISKNPATTSELMKRLAFSRPAVLIYEKLTGKNCGANALQCVKEWAQEHKEKTSSIMIS